MTDFLKTLGIEDTNAGGFDGGWIGTEPELVVISPVDGERIGTVRQVTEAEYDRISGRAHAAYGTWSRIPAPKRGEIVRQIGNRLRERKAELGRLVTREMGKILAEGEARFRR